MPDLCGPTRPVIRYGSGLGIAQQITLKPPLDLSSTGLCAVG
jgi:hypothetical protein